MPAKKRVYIEVLIGNKTGGRIVFELFDDVAPMAAENFRGLCTGEYGNSKTTGLPLSFKGCRFFRVTPGLMAQSGDFECNNGDGGESIYGGTFKDESFMRRHAQAGVLSMANKGLHTNGSQFFITLKRAPQLDGKHVAFGQIVQGIDVLRAIEKCPIDGSNTPRISIVIVDCGEAEKPSPVRRNDPKFQMRDSVAALMATLNVPAMDSTTRPVVPDQPNISSMHLAQSVEPSREVSSPTGDKYGTESFLDDAGAIEDRLDLNDERQKKLYELRLRLKQSRKLNAKEVADGHHQKKDSKTQFIEQKRLLAETLKKFDEAIQPDKKSERRNAYISGKEYLNESADIIQLKDAKTKKKQSNTEKSFGWNAINTDSHYRAHKKRTAGLTFNDDAYAKQILQFGDEFYNPSGILVSAEFKPTEDAKEKLATEIERQREKRKTFSRRRMHIEDENVQHINEFNRSFNKKLEKAYGNYSLEIRQNLERGTAL